MTAAGAGVRPSAGEGGIGREKLALSGANIGHLNHFSFPLRYLGLPSGTEMATGPLAISPLYGITDICCQF